VLSFIGIRDCFRLNGPRLHRSGEIVSIFAQRLSIDQTMAETPTAFAGNPIGLPIAAIPKA
jgi:hypothetical protein